MSEVERTHHIEIKGEIPPHIFAYLKKELGENVTFVNEDDELIDIRNTKWYKEIHTSMTHGNSLKVYRENAGLTQDQLGKVLGQFSKQYISDIENGRRNISKKLAKKLSNTFNVPIDRFI